MTTKTEGRAATVRPRSGLRRGADLAYGYLAAFFVLGVLFQVYLAGVGVFGINARKVADASSLGPHRAWGSVLMVLALVLLTLALVARQSAAVVLSTLLLAALVIVAQIGLATAGGQQQVAGRRARAGRHDHPAALAVAGHRGMAQAITQQRILITLRNAGACLPDNQTDAVDVGTPELTSPASSACPAGSQVAPVRPSPVAFGS